MRKARTINNPANKNIAQVLAKRTESNITAIQETFELIQQSYPLCIVFYLSSTQKLKINLSYTLI